MSWSKKMVMSSRALGMAWRNRVAASWESFSSWSMLWLVSISRPRSRARVSSWPGSTARPKTWMDWGRPSSRTTKSSGVQVEDQVAGGVADGHRDVDDVQVGREDGRRRRRPLTGRAAAQTDERGGQDGRTTHPGAQGFILPPRGRTQFTPKLNWAGPPGNGTRQGGSG